jgi:hypothetical protein
MGVARGPARGAGRRRWPVLLVLLATVAGCGPAKHGPAAPPPTRSAGFRHCPEAHVRPLPAGFRLVRRDLSALGDQHMGELKIYRSGRSQIQVFSGPDVYDKLDDMDLVSRRVSVRGRTFELWTTTIDRNLLVAQLVDDRLRQPCDNVGVLTRHVPRATFMGLLRDLRLAPGPANQ